jgi:predicted TIM-barrel fold metal-dependent hydrolase
MRRPAIEGWFSTDGEPHLLGTRVVDEIGIDPIVFGSDFPHGEGLAYPAQYASGQLGGFSDEDVKQIMRDNLEEFFVGAA